MAIGLSIAVGVGVSMSFPPGHPLDLMVVPGAVLLGIGARINGACMFGTVARLGSGQWSFALTPLGFLIGQILFLRASTPIGRTLSPGASPMLFATALVLIPAALFALWRIAGLVQAARQRRLSSHLWSAHGATAVIGLCFVVLMLAVGPWAYTEALTDLAAGRMASEALRAGLVVALVAGSIFAGAAGGALRSESPTMRSAGRCLTGGALMGMGSLVVPGGNDSLLLVGMPFLQPYAWAAVALMTATIAVIPFAAPPLARAAG